MGFQFAGVSFSSWMPVGRVLVCLAVVGAGWVQVARAQTSQNPPPQPTGFHEGRNPYLNEARRQGDSGKLVEDQRRFRALNVIRQKDMLSETAKLLQLASELKLEVDRAASNALSIGAAVKVEQIEKLAHSVQTSMTVSMGK